MGAYGRLLRYVCEIKKEIFFKVLLSLIISASYIFQAVIMAKAVTSVFTGASAMDITWLLFLAFAAILLRSFVQRYIEVYGKAISARVKNKIRMLVLNKILSLGPQYMTAQRSGKVSSLALDGIESLEPFLINYVPQIFTVSISGIAVGAYLCSIDLTAGLVVVIAMLLCVTVPYLTVPLISRNIFNYWSIYSKLTSQYIDSIQGMTTLKSVNATAKKGQELKKDANTFYKQAIQNTGISLINSGIMLILTSAASGVTVIVAALRADMGILPVTAVSAFLFLAAECARPMLELNRHWHSSFLGLSVAKELFDLLDTSPPVKENEKPDRHSLDLGFPSISLQNVTFSYRKDIDAVSNVTFEIKAGSTVAIVGRSGSGKSTMLNLILRFYDTSTGRILLNGVDIQDYSLEYLQSKIGVVFQDSYLFCGTVAENIRMARPEASDAEVYEAAKAANIHDFIMSMPEGYSTAVGERGANLSGGQRQRLSIARAILKNAPILLLDEATSSVDGKSEALIQSALDSLTQNRTTIIVAHRLSTIQNADKIFVLDEGRLVEQGSHEELLALGGSYAALIKKQEEGSH